MRTRINENSIIDPNQLWVKPLLKRLYLVFIILGGFYLVYYSVFIGFEINIIITISIFEIGLLSSYYLLTRDKIIWAYHLVLLMLWVALTYLMVNSGGFNNSATYIYIIIILISGLVFPLYIGIIYTIFSIISVISLYYLTQEDIIPKKPYEVDQFGILLEHIGLFILVGFTLNMLSSLVQRSFQELQKTKKEINKMEIEYSTILQQAGDAIVIANRDGKILDANDKALELFKYTQEEIISKEIPDLITTESKKYLPLQFQNLEDGNLIKLEREVQDKTGKKFHVEVTVKLIEQRKTIAIIRNIETRKMYEKQLKAQTKQQEIIANLGVEAIRETNLESLMKKVVKELSNTLNIEHCGIFRITNNQIDLISYYHLQSNYINKAMSEEYIKKLLPFITNSRKPVVVHDFNKFIENSIASDFIKYDIISGFGNVIKKGQDDIAIIAGYDHHKRIYLPHEINFIISLSNILSTSIERKEVEIDLLEKEEVLSQSQKMEALGRLAGGVSHDFNNLLTAIFGYSELGLLYADEGSNVHQSMLEIKKAAEQGKEFTQQLLALSKKQNFEFQVVNVNDILDNMKSVIYRLTGENITVKFNLMENLPNIRIDTGQINQVVMNLIVNAKEAMPDGGKIHISTNRISKGEITDIDKTVLKDYDEFVLLRVRDEGKGLNDDLKKKIFDPFFTTKDSGTGLGLSTTYGILNQSDSHIVVDNNHEVGAVFKIYFPVVDMELTSLNQDKRYIKSDLSGSILLVDDDDQIRDVITKRLKKEGFVIYPAKDGQDAYNFCKNFTGTIDLMITDIIMPKLNGTDLAQKLTQIMPDLKVIFISGYPETDLLNVHNITIEIPEIPFLQKPFQFDELLELISITLQYN